MVRSGDRFGENSCEGAKSMDRRESEEKMENIKSLKEDQSWNVSAVCKKKGGEGAF